MFHFCFRWTKNVYLPLCKWCEVIKQCFPRSPVSAGCYLSKFSLFTVKKKKKVLSFLQQTHKKRQHNPEPYFLLLLCLSHMVFHHSSSPRHLRYNKGASRRKSSISYIKVTVSPCVGWKNPYRVNFFPFFFLEKREVLEVC